MSGSGSQWDVKGQDVPNGRVTRSLIKGLSQWGELEREEEKSKRRRALDRLRAHARHLKGQERDALWSLVPRISRAGHPTWADLVAATSKSDFLALAFQGEHHAMEEARDARTAEWSERRTCSQGVARYLSWKERERFAADTVATDKSLLTRCLQVSDSEGRLFGDRTVASLVRADAERILSNLLVSDRTRERVSDTTRAKQRKILHAWMSWELQREQDRAEESRRLPLFTKNIFSDRGARYSKPTKDATATVEDVTSRRFYPDEMAALLSAATGSWRYILICARRLGLRSGELIHLRWLEDVRPLPGDAGYEVRLDGGRGRDPRCKCRQCRARGWSPKNGPRRYVLDRRYDRIGWVREVCEAIDAWVTVRTPRRGDFLFPDPSDWSRPFTNNKLNGGLHQLAAVAGVVTGVDERGGKTFHSLRHTCASELLEVGVTHPHAAYWIGDTMREFLKTYGRPRDEEMARSIFDNPLGTSGGE